MPKTVARSKGKWMSALTLTRFWDLAQRYHAAQGHDRAMSWHVCEHGGCVQYQKEFDHTIFKGESGNPI